MWFCLIDGKEFGPYSQSETEQFLIDNPTAYFWKEGYAEWMPASKFSFKNSKNVVAPSTESLFESNIDFSIVGDDMQYVEFLLKEDESVIAEAGAMIYKDTHVIPQAVMGMGKKNVFKKLFGAGKRILTGENFFLMAFTNTNYNQARVAFSAPYSGKIIPVSLQNFDGEIICQKDSFLCATSDVDIDIYFQKKIMTALFGGAGFIMQRLVGDGVVFIHAGGMVTEFELQEYESMQVDIGSLVAFSSGIDFSIVSAGNMKSQLFGGSGIFYANLMGPGKIWVQSLPFSKLAQRFSQIIYPRKKINR